MKISKKIMTVSLLLSAGYAGLVSAHTQSGAVGLAGSGLAKTDVYTLACPTSTAKLYIRVKDLAPVKAPSVSIQATKGTSSSALSTDAVDGDANYSPALTLSAGSGTYTFKVNKSAYTGTSATHKGAETYVAEIHCQDSAGNHLAQPDPVMTQNQ